MRVPIDWLKELIIFRSSPGQVAQMLTMSGLETVVLPDDILEVDVLPNRSDCWSVRGVAREVSALTKFKVKSSKFKIKESSKKLNHSVRVEVRDKDLCPRYMARVIENVKVAESPEWLKKRLEQSGLRPVNNVVDVTNYFLHEIGQPMHAFDSTLVKDQSIIVRRANPGEKVVTLDGKEHKLESNMLVIADSDKTIAVAGTLGCANTEVSAATKTVILESAYFNPNSIHKTSKDLKLRTESSVRFEHGVDWNAVEETLDRGAALIAELGRGEVLKGKVDSVGKEIKQKVIELRVEKVNRILGADIPVGDMTSILIRLGFSVKKIDSRKLKIGVPLFRSADIEREIDLIEEIARIWGYNRIEATIPNTAFPGKDADREDRLRNRIRDILAGCGLNESQSYSMLGPKDFENCGAPSDKAVKIANPLTIEESIMRVNILAGLLKTAVHNQNRGIENIFIFEIGKVFLPAKGKLPEEKWLAGGLVSGSPFMSALDKGEVDYYYLKGILENLFRGLGLEFPDVSESDNYLLQPGKGAKLEGLGIFGALHPDIQRNFELAKPIFFFELDLDALAKLAAAEKKYEPLPKFPSISRDISMFLPADLNNQTIIETVERTGGDLVEDVFPFDRYKDSAAYRIVYRHPTRTLTEQEVNAKHQEIVRALTSKLMVRLRA
ncbi:phenylalanine--tRNA ligase subunit beta [candidate division WOR-1 bacterium RIFCSPHIGHO2_02_FULL_53_26]|nr:MAG: phenylalanine--tRNA ligase subunit beta [candidate division WOR-1 bacterium RIFCSPHIGHO2_02_FULL_53_26]